MADFKLALNAGHYKGTAGKRVMKTLDPNETREWVLNNRVADRVEQLLKQNYTGYQLLRIDDTTGETDIPLQKRTDSANQWKADLYLSIHHNAGINGGKGGGIVAIVYTAPQNESVQWQKAFYDELIRQTGLKGNRAEPLTQQNLHEVRETVMPAVLLELGFMDSSVDVPIILTDKFADQCADAIVRVIAQRAELTRKSGIDPLYRVQVGAFNQRKNAEALLEKLKDEGYSDAFIT